MGKFDRLRLSEHRQLQLVRGMEIGLIVLFFIGIERGSPGVIVNTGVGLVVLRLPAIIERDLDLPMDPRLVLWISSAAFLHAFGVVGIPGLGWTFYTGLWWWDHLTHALSASVVAAAGYATVRAIDIHSAEVEIPPRFVAVIILIFVLAFGVAWELLEFFIGVGADLTGTPGVLTQYGIEDTLKDFTFNSIGGLLVAIYGGIYLTDLSDAISEKLGQ